MRKSLLLLALFCAACSNYSANLPSIKPYRMDIQQGNVVTPKMMMQLRPGMSKAQVKFIMGTPLVTDPFHSNRWDYFYQMRKDGKIIEQRRVIMEFENDKLARIRGDVIPAGSDAQQTAGQPANKAPVTLKSVGDPKPKEKGLLDSLKFWGDDETAPAAQPQAAPQTPAEPAAKSAPAVAPSVAPAAESAKDSPKELEAVAAPAPEPAAKSEPQPEPVAKPEAAAAPEAQAKPEPQAQLEPVVKSAPAEEAAKAAAPAESSGPRIELQPNKPRRPAAAPRSEPAPAAEPQAAQAAASSRSSSVAQEKPAEPAAASESRPAVRPADELPPEDAPDYFERMLEKIGF